MRLSLYEAVPPLLDCFAVIQVLTHTYETDFVIDHTLFSIVRDIRDKLDGEEVEVFLVLLSNLSLNFIHTDDRGWSFAWSGVIGSCVITRVCVFLTCIELPLGVGEGSGTHTLDVLAGVGVVQPWVCQVRVGLL